ncbi:hypothetical protein CLV60_116121 [Dyadobacter jiangsuensis]|uniref:Uncharacterized protein n=1 Tax=Dyadobacter jiangsuensis TaxID=1591085 RepID=A0A2P8FPH9_9BACT|nr:hypothetical protein CLV60_116121 [Dyadobacter jiangsuensis]
MSGIAVRPVAARLGKEAILSDKFVLEIVEMGTKNV